MESTASIAGTALEQSNWFRRGLQVRSSAAVPASMTSSTLDFSINSVSSSSALRPTDLALHPTGSESALNEVKLNGVNTPPIVLHESLEVMASTPAGMSKFIIDIHSYTVSGFIGTFY